MVETWWRIGGGLERGSKEAEARGEGSQNGSAMDTIVEERRWIRLIVEELPRLFRRRSIGGPSHCTSDLVLRSLSGVWGEIEAGVAASEDRPQQRTVLESASAKCFNEVNSMD